MLIHQLGFEGKREHHCKVSKLPNKHYLCSWTQNCSETSHAGILTTPFPGGLCCSHPEERKQPGCLSAFPEESSQVSDPNMRLLPLKREFQVDRKKDLVFMLLNMQAVL
jgi:hypothetical protein